MCDDLDEIDKYISGKYTNFYIERNINYLGCKYNQEDRYCIFYIKCLGEKLLLVIRDDVNIREKKEIYISDFTLKDIKCCIDSILLHALENKPNTISKKNNNLKNKLFDKVNYPLEIDYDCEEFFSSLKEIPKEKRKENKYSSDIHLDRLNIKVATDSSYEIKILQDLDNCEFVKGVKTQSLEIKRGKKKKYIPDIVVLCKDSSIVIIEVKDFNNMISSRSIKNYEILNEYCEKKGFGYIMCDNKYRSFDIILNTDISNNKTREMEKKFIRDVKKKELKRDDIKRYKKKFGKFKFYKILYNNRYNLVIDRNVQSIKYKNNNYFRKKIIKN